MSNINFTCPICSHHLSLPAALHGRQGKCPSCNSVVTIHANTTANPSIQPLQQQPLQQQRVNPRLQNSSNALFSKKTTFLIVGVSAVGAMITGIVVFMVFNGNGSVGSDNIPNTAIIQSTQGEAWRIEHEDTSKRFAFKYSALNNFYLGREIFDATTGTLIGTLPVAGENIYPSSMSTSTDGHLVMTTATKTDSIEVEHSELFLLSPDHSLLWRTPFEGHLFAAKFGNNELIYAIHERQIPNTNYTETLLIGILASRGIVVWETKLDEIYSAKGEIAVDDRGLVYIAVGKSLYVVDGMTGKQVKSIEFEDYICHGPIVVDADSVIVIHQRIRGNRLVSYSTSDWSVRWNMDTSYSKPYLNSARNNNDILFLAMGSVNDDIADRFLENEGIDPKSVPVLRRDLATDHSVTAINMQTGTEQWQYELTTTLLPAMGLGSNNIIYVEEKESIIAINGDDGTSTTLVTGTEGYFSFHFTSNGLLVGFQEIEVTGPEASDSRKYRGRHVALRSSSPNKMVRPPIANTLIQKPRGFNDNYNSESNPPTDLGGITTTEKPPPSAAKPSTTNSLGASNKSTKPAMRPDTQNPTTKPNVPAAGIGVPGNITTPVYTLINSVAVPILLQNGTRMSFSSEILQQRSLTSRGTVYWVVHSQRLGFIRFPVSRAGGRVSGVGSKFTPNSGPFKAFIVSVEANGEIKYLSSAVNIQWNP